MLKNNNIETANLILRQFCMEDVSVVYSLSQEEDMRRWIPDQVYEDEKEAADVLQYLMAQYMDLPTPNKTPYVLGVVLKETDELIGHVGLSPIDKDVEIGYAIAENQQGKGYATEAVVAITKWAINVLGLSEVLGIVDSKNQASCKVLEKSGFDFVEKNSREAFGRNCLCRVYRKDNGQ